MTKEQRRNEQNPLSSTLQSLEAMAMTLEAVQAMSPIVDVTPLIHRPSPCDRQKRLEESSQSLLLIQEQEEIFSRIMARLENFRERLKVRETKIKQSVSPVFAVPPELLANIFEFAVLSSNASRSRITRTLAQVSSEWRKTIVSQSSLWCDVDVTDFHAPRVGPWIDRSGHRLMDVSIRATPPASARWLAETTVQSRLRSLSVPVCDIDDPTHAILDEGAFSRLTRLCLSVPEFIQYERKPIVEILSHRLNAPKLSYLSLDRLRLTNFEYIPLSITQLVVTRVTVSLDAWTDIFVNLKRLTDLRVDEVKIPGTWAAELEENLPPTSLTRLRIDNCDTNTLIRIVSYAKGSPKLRFVLAEVPGWTMEERHIRMNLLSDWIILMVQLVTALLPEHPGPFWISTSAEMGSFRAASSIRDLNLNL